MSAKKVPVTNVKTKPLVKKKESNKSGKVLNNFQHALIRPEPVIGSRITIRRDCWIYSSDNNSEESEGGDGEDEGTSSKKAPKIVLKKIKFNAGLTKIFGEIMSNAIDNLWRSQKYGLTMKRIEFVIPSSPEDEYYGWITVINDGYCIPIEKAKYEFADFRTGDIRNENLYPAEVFFGEMNAGTNFEDEDGKKTSGTFGWGAKAAVIFSKAFTVEHTNPEHHKMLIQNYSENGTVRDKPVVTSYKNKTGYTSISFLPDYEYFGYPGMDDDYFSLIKRYIYECAMITGLPVILNGEKIVVKDLGKYVRLFYPDAKENSLFSFKAPNGDECVVIEKGVPEKEVEDEVPHVSWVNGVSTRDGGVHVDAWRKAIFPILVKEFNSRKPKKGEKTVLKTAATDLYPYFTIFVRAEIEGPKFDGAPKDQLVGYINDKGEIVSKLNLAKEGVEKKEFTKQITEATKKILKWNFVTMLEEKLAMKADRTQSRKEGSSKKVPATKNYRPANLAGTKRARECMLGIGEGLSAAAFIDQLIAKVPDAKDLVGRLAIRGKFINVQNATAREINANVEVGQLKKILGLVTGLKYDEDHPENLKLLKYGKILLATDQDDDGFHIRGLVLNFIYWGWPELFSLKCPDGTNFIESLSTAVAIARWGKSMKIFFSNPEYRTWLEGPEPKTLKGMTVKYYKGLGTHEPGEEDIYLGKKEPSLRNLKRVQYYLDEEVADYMDLGFNKHQADWRKVWITRDIRQAGDETPIEMAVPITVDGELSLSSFVDTQLKIYHIMALRRALPNMYDGFKESQRKAFYGIAMNKKARKGVVNLENLAGSVKESTGYHHGGSSLENTIVKMAQGFVGTNNIPLLKNAGQFGHRTLGGEECSAARYIFTGLEEVTNAIFCPEDKPLLQQRVEDDVKVEYELFMPIIPVILINGADGIASGYSTKIPCYNPEDIVSWIELWLDSEDGSVNLPWLVPWYRGFNGENELLKRTGKTTKLFDPETDEGPPTAWRSKGILEKGKADWWHIREIPIGMWTNTMTEHLEYLLSGTPPEKSKKKKGEKYLRDVKLKGTINAPVWDIKPTKDFIPDMNVTGNFKNMQNTFSLTNIHVIDENNFPRKFASPEELLGEFCPRRLSFYDKRKAYWLKKYKIDVQRETDRYKYVKLVVEKKLNMHQKGEKLELDMKKAGLRKFATKKESKNTEDDEEEVDVLAAEATNVSYDYLLSMQMRSMTVERLAKIKEEMEKTQVKLDELENKTSKDLWRGDLERFKVAYAKFLKTRKEE